MSDFALIKNGEDLSSSKLDVDVFIFSKGAEDRSYTVINNYLDNISPQRIILIDSRMKIDDLSEKETIKYESIDTIVSQKGIVISKMISVEDTNIGKSLINEGFSSETKVAIDISSMNFWEFSDLLYFLLKYVKVKRVDILYTEPDLYHYENDNLSDYDYKYPKVSVKYLNSYYSTKTTDEEILVSMIGFQKNVNKLFKDIFEVSQYYSINGFPSFYPKAKDISQTNNFDYLSEIYPSNKYSADAINPFITFNTLGDISKASKGLFMNICPLCSKPMAIGACLYALRHPDSTRIVYPFEEGVITKADGIGHTYCYSIESEFFD